MVADTLSRIESVKLPSEIEYEELAVLQKGDAELKELIESKVTSTVLKQMTSETSKVPVYFEISTKNLRPYIPKQLRRQIFNRYHRLAHSSGKATLKVISQRYFWPFM